MYTILRCPCELPVDEHRWNPCTFKGVQCRWSFLQPCAGNDHSVDILGDQVFNVRLEFSSITVRVGGNNRDITIWLGFIDNALFIR